jgi:hypothetical protein
VYLFKVDGETLVFEYWAERDFNWVRHELDAHQEVTIAKVFHFTSDDLIGDLPEYLRSFGDEEDTQDEEKEIVGRSFTFSMGTVNEEYYRIKKSVLGTRHDVLLGREIELERRIFSAHRDISIFKNIDAVVNQPIAVGGPNENCLPLEAFEELLRKFPTSTELTRYSRARVHNILKDYFGTMSDAEQQYQTYLTRRRKAGRTLKRNTQLYALEVEKFEFIRDRITEMLVEEQGYAEKDWQKLMVDFLLIIFPKYVAVLENVQVKDFYSTPGTTKNRYIDFALVDAAGNLDIIEIKKPSEDGLLATAQYRDNYVPRYALSGTIMQTEKYLMHLNKWGVLGERALTTKYANQLPAGLSVKVTNPKGLVITGRSKRFDPKQQFDFDILRRKYANVVDIITYDDLLGRLENLITLFRARAS